MIFETLIPKQMKEEHNSRRNFLKNAALTGMATAGAISIPKYAHGEAFTIENSPRKAWIAGVSQEGIVKDTAGEMIDEIFRFMDQVLVYRPDIICTPEVFPWSNVRQSYTLDEKVEISGKVLARLTDYARKNKCYIIGSVYTRERGKTYNAGVVIDRKGAKIGEYRKTYCTEGEIRSGLTPGPLKPPVFQTDFGKIGIQICFDILWDTGWVSMKEQGAEIIFWPSAYGGGQNINAKAGQHRYAVASSTRKGASKLCDMSSEVISYTGSWDKNFYCGPVNLEKVFLHSWPYVRRFDEIRQKYGRKVLIRNYHEEEWSTIESLSPDVTIQQIMKEFDLKSYDQHKRDAEVAQTKARTVT
jgi:beta-ureidopropionase